MDKKTSIGAIIFGAALVAVLIAAGQDLIPVSGTRQEWKLKNSDAPGMVRFTIDRWKPGSRWSTTTDVRLANFRGLSREMIERGGAARFEYVQDAGSLICEGSFSWIGGSGTYRFEPNRHFTTELRSLGYETPDEEQLFSMMLGGVNLEFARGAHDAGLRATTQQLIELRNHGVSTEYIRDAFKAGYRGFDAPDFVNLKNHGVSSWFLRDLKGYGYDLSSRDIVDLTNHGVSSEFLGELKNAGYKLSSAQITELSNHGVDSKYVRDLKDFGLQPGASDLVQLKNHGVSTGFLKGLKEAGYGDIPTGDIVNLTAHGVGVEFIQDARDLGYDFTPQQLIDLRSHGVDGAYLKHLRDAGLKNLNAEKIEKLRTHGVE